MFLNCVYFYLIMLLFFQNVICDVDVEDVNFDITVTQVKDKDKTVTPFSLNVKRISGKVSICFL